MSTDKKCAHEICTCKAKPDSKYCSRMCEDAKGMTSLACDCGHPECDHDKI